MKPVDIGHISGNGDDNGYIPPQSRKLYDPDVCFEEYIYYATHTRAEQDSHPPERSFISEITSKLLPRSQKSSTGSGENPAPVAIEEKSHAARAVILEEEWMNASRAFRTASAGACFFLITTDILGPFGVGFSLGTMGWGPGFALFTAFGIMAGYSGYLLWTCFMGLDSYQFPLRNYADLAFRIYGSTMRHIFNVLQSIQLLFSVGLIVISNGQALSQVSQFRLCYAICCLIWAISGFIVGQIRTLRQYGWLANCAVWINLSIMFITMGAFAHSPPNYAISKLGSAGSLVDPTTITPDSNGNYPPVIHYSGLPNSGVLVAALNGLMQAVYAYGGALLFIEFMAEMKRPRDFLKAMWGAQAFIWAVYLIYGSYTYYFQGQYTYQISYQGVSSYALQTVGNIFAIVSGIIAAGLYGNIGIKVLYNNILMDLFKFPPLNTQAGKVLWAVIVPIYWTIAFIIAAAIPDFFGLVSVVGAFATVQFTYSFPPLLALGYTIKRAAISDTEGFDPASGRVIRADWGFGRWFRGFFSGSPAAILFNIWNLVYMLGAFSTAGLGAYAAIQGMIDVFQNPQINSFTCTSPLNLG